MSGEYDVLTNQPVVIDNVCQTIPSKPYTRIMSAETCFQGFWNNQSRFRWTGSPKMFFPIFVRLRGFDTLLNRSARY